jgi:hypothetical protein
MGQLAAFLVTVFKGSQALRDLFQETVRLYYAAEEAADTREMSEIDKQRDALAAALKQPGMTDAQRNTIRRQLIALSRR